MNKFAKIIRFIFRSSWQQKIEVSQVLFLFLKFSFITKVIPLKYYYNRYFYPLDNKNELKMQLYKYELSLISRLRRFIPWETGCLVNSLVTKEYFKTLCVDVPIFVGVSLDNGFFAHAWCISLNTIGYNEICHNYEK